ncbi:MAG: MBL fold metallo-hydrolase [Candidatus Zixiibacteriota bacterium]
MAELQTRLGHGGPLFVLDIRPAGERAEWAIPGSSHLDIYQALKNGDLNAAAAVAPPPNTTVVAVCGAGNTSKIAAEQLRKRGLPAVSLIGGMKAWSLAWNTAEMTSSDATLVQIRRTGKGCLSYIVASGNEAVVVDAALDPAIFLGIARTRGWAIRHVLDTHIHADHLSRSCSLAGQAGASLWLPEQRRVSFTYRPLHEGETLAFGKSTLTCLSTPGHTRESVCYVIDNRWLLTGDTLFLDTVGRPDLEADPDESLARAILLHGSLRRLFELEPELMVLPCHTSSPVPFDRTVITAILGAAREAVHLGYDAEAFARDLLRRVPLTPPNHHVIVKYNEAGVLPSGDLTDLEAGANRCAVV